MRIYIGTYVGFNEFAISQWNPNSIYAWTHNSQRYTSERASERKGEREREKKQQNKQSIGHKANVISNKNRNEIDCFLFRCQQNTNALHPSSWAHIIFSGHPILMVESNVWINKNVDPWETICYSSFIHIAFVFSFLLELKCKWRQKMLQFIPWRKVREKENVNWNCCGTKWTSSRRKTEIRSQKALKIQRNVYVLYFSITRLK